MDLHPGPTNRPVIEVTPAKTDPIRRALQESEDWYQDLMDHSQDLLCVHDLEGRLLSVNPASARQLGYSVEEMLQIPMREHIAPEFRNEFDTYLKRIEREGEARGLLLVVTRLGEQRIWEYSNTLRREGTALPVVSGTARDVTELRQTEKLLQEATEGLLHRVRESERVIRELKLFRTLMDQSNDAIEVVDPETLRFLDANEKACLDLGYSREELLSLGVLDIDPAVNEHSIAKVKEVLRKSGFMVMESVHRRKNGTTFPVEVSMKRVQLERDYVIAIARDLTQRKETEARLQESESRYRAVHDRSPVGICRVETRTGRFLEVNPKYCEIVGRTEQDLLGRNFQSITHPDDLARNLEKLQRLYQGEVRHYEMEKRCIRPDGSVRWAEIEVVPMWPEGDGPGWHMAIVQDITERKQAEEDLRNSERQQQRIAKQLETERARLIEAQAVAKVGSWEIDLPNLEITWSEQTHRIFETEPSHFRPRRPDFVKLIHPEDRAKVDAVFEASLERGAPSTVEYRIVMADGRVKLLEEHWKVFHNEQGSPVRLVGTCRDITERQQAEEALRSSEEKYRLFVSQSSEGIFREELDAPLSINLPEDELVHHILFDSYLGECNDALARMYGLESGKELVGKRMTEMVVPDDPHNLELTREYIRSGFRVLERESHEIDIHGNPKIFLNSMIGTVENGMLVRTWGIQRDITEKVRLEEARGNAEETLRQNVAQLRQVTEELRLAKEKLAEEKLYLQESIDTELGFGEIIGRSDAMKEVLEKVAKVAPSDATVLLLGETGTGKELAARALHRLSKRQGSSFIKLNCAAIPSGLLESELFGHEKGAFTGAVARKLGRLELADKGTLFLDEIGEIPLSLQPKLLRVIQDQEFERLGGTQTLKVNFRLVAATNRDLFQSVQAREFRSDLYYRLRVFPILIPPLRERREDIRPLIEHFVRKFAAQMKKSIVSIPAKTMESLVRWEWPGNIRELENFVERSVILTPGSVLQAPLSELQADSDNGNGNGRDNLRDTERERILRTLRDCHGKLGGADGAAARLGLKRTTLQSKLDTLGIKPGQYRT
jgi:formate hydrogenlyase transcriptional activator